MAFLVRRNLTTRDTTAAIPDETTRQGTGIGMEVGMTTVRKAEATDMDGNFLRDATKDGAETGLDRGTGQGSTPMTGGSAGSRLWRDASPIGHPSGSKRLHEGRQVPRRLLVGLPVLHQRHVDRSLLSKSEGVRC